MESIFASGANSEARGVAMDAHGLLRTIIVSDAPEVSMDRVLLADYGADQRSGADRRQGERRQLGAAAFTYMLEDPRRGSVYDRREATTDRRKIN